MTWETPELHSHDIQDFLSDNFFSVMSPDMICPQKGWENFFRHRNLQIDPAQVEGNGWSASEQPTFLKLTRTVQKPVARRRALFQKLSAKKNE